MAGTITRRTMMMVSELYDEFRSLVREEFITHALANLKQSCRRSDRPSKIKTLRDLLLKCGVDCEKDRETSYYEKLVNDLIKSGTIPSSAELENRMLAAFFKASLKYASPQDYLTRLINRLIGNKWENDPLRLRLLRQFIAEGGALAYKVQRENGKKQTVYIYKGKHYLTEYAKNRLGVKPATDVELAEAMDDGVFDILKGAKRDDIKSDGKYGLIKMISDLASGYFRTGGNTKRALYLFAMVFGMSFYTGSTTKWSSLPVIRDSDTDIELNLFVDFYCNNMIRYMRQEYDDVQLTQVDTDPSGHGINFKNYAEIIYLYFISRTDLDAREKLSRSNEMLLEIDRRLKEGLISPVVTDYGDHSGENNPSMGTAHYMQMVYGTENIHYDIFGMGEEELLEFICLHYACDRGQKGFLQVSAEQNTAYGIYRELRKRLAIQLKCRNSNLNPLSSVSVTEEETERYLKECQEGIWFCDPAWNVNNVDSMMARIEPYVAPEVYPKEEYERFARMMNCCHGILGGQGAQARLHIDSPEKVTRSALLTVYYYYFNVRQSMIKDIEDMSFEEVFNFFAGLCPEESVPDNTPESDSAPCSLDAIRHNPACMNPDLGLNTLLLSAYYQPLNGKNIFDVITVFSSYWYYSD